MKGLSQKTNKQKKIHRSPVNTNVKDNYRGGIHFTLTMEFSLKKISQIVSYVDKGVEEMENGTTTFCWFLNSTPRYKYGKGQCSNAQTFTEVLLTAPNGS